MINIKRDISSCTLHMIAMLLMFCDHLWGTIMIQYDWLTQVGRLAFPIFAFLLVEGYYHTHDLKKYILRLTVFALISEIPFNIMYGGNVIYPFHQNVLWTFVIALSGMGAMGSIKKKRKLWFTIIGTVLVVGLTYVLATMTMVDYYGAGVLMVYAFYFFRGEKLWQKLGQLLTLLWINCSLLGGLMLTIHILGKEIYFYQQVLAVFSLVFIWMYHGRQGYHNRWVQYGCYVFYPLHALILGLIYYGI